MSAGAERQSSPSLSIMLLGENLHREVRSVRNVHNCDLFPLLNPGHKLPSPILNAFGAIIQDVKELKGKTHCGIEGISPSAASPVAPCTICESEEDGTTVASCCAFWPIPEILDFSEFCGVSAAGTRDLDCIKKRSLADKRRPGRANQCIQRKSTRYMASSASDWLVYLSFILVLGVIRYCLRRQNKSQSLPPGPPPKPLIGNYLDVPKAEPWKIFSQWRKLYGDLVYVNVLGNKLLILNDMESVRELLEKRSQKYSDRPSFVMAKYMGIENNLAFAPYGPDWRQGRKLVHGAVNQEAVKKYHSLQEDVTVRFLRNLVESPSEVMKHLHMATAHIIASITYGFSIDTPSNVYFDEFAETERIVLKSVVPGAYLVDMIPLLWYLPSWIPFNSIQRTAERGLQRVTDIVRLPMQQVEQDMKQGISPSSFVSDHLREGGSDEVIRQRLPWVAWSLYEAGNDTTSGSMLVFMHAMACFPEVQTRMREEIYRVIGTGRLPSFADRERLPYINAAIKEVYRWKPNTPLGGPRKLQNADVYRGYYIPKGTIIMPNIWLLSRDQDSGIDPEVFSPERFLDTHVKKTAIDPYSYAFGFGRRMCPGRFLADNSVFMLVTSIVATVRISKPKDSRGMEKPFDPPYIPAGLASFPYPFEVDIEPVSDKAVAVVNGRATSID